MLRVNKMKAYWLHCALLISVILLLASCNDNDGSADPLLGPQQQELNVSRSRWNSQSIDNYQFTVRRSCFCVLREDIVVMVLNDQVDSAFYTPSGVFLNANELTQVFTMEGYFDIIQQAIDNQVDDLEVNYHMTLGYPTSIAIDNRLNVADDEIAYLIMDFQ